ncbi:unnamed protein product [Echinostoma caproni]|uniref:C-type lectin domain-containing protein n=1 Tax=Echinostoma caproni TaxID=27848 RepID=A0A183ASL5_9TREM|nr:unnamed protein product [Echinostoma caproni]
MGRTQPPVSSMTTCPVGWTRVNGQCYLAAPVGVRRSWLDAEQACQDATKLIPSAPGLIYAGHLASVHSVEEQTQLVNLSPAASTWFANIPNKSVHFVWSDASPVDYLSLSVEQLRQVLPQSSCLSVGESTGVAWTPLDCYQPRSYICQLTIVRQVESVLTVPDSEEDIM